MKGHCYPYLVEVFYTNLRVVNGFIHSRVKVVNITIDDNVWSHIAGLKAEGLDSHIRDSESNRWLTKRAIYVNYLRYPRRYTVDKQYLYDGLNKEKKLIAYVLTWLLLPGRFVEDKIDELTVGSTPTPTADHTAFIPQTDFEKYVVDQFRKKSERDERVEDKMGEEGKQE
ncbi:hypothetical protein LR48_Vigan05g078600 [Vigna angularis]|uniref:Uncharacterized protein n=1 Tax=Phaseolus angularis TaxID=3914 RepID=A0A0L9UKT3_PHAAN|nr:hypothetical protein LR48_Vigan05g078600 [Vigna angularis]